MAGTDEAIRTTVRGGVGLIVLNRPAALNALSPAMVAALAETLAAWREDPAVTSLVLKGEGGRAFSAGADVRAMWAHAKAGEFGAVRDYFAAEYALDLMLARYPKPVLAVVNGICFGGGMALAVHSRHAIAGELASFSMPETLIGFFPDAGVTHFLSHLPGALGNYLGMTGARLSGADAVHLGLVSHYVPGSEHDRAIGTFAREGAEALECLTAPLPPFSLASRREAIDACFGGESVAEIVHRLRAHRSEWARETLATLEQRSPASLEWTLSSLRAGRGRTLEECLQAELELVAVSTTHPDFVEGVRAALVDKDRQPSWQQR